MFIFLLALLWIVLTRASIFSDVAGFFTGSYKSLKDLAGKVYGALKHAVSWVTGIFRNVGTAWGELHSAFTVLISGLEHVANGAYSSIKWLTNNLIPKFARKAVTDAVNWAVRNIKTLADKAIKLAGQVKSWANRRINDVLDFARKGINAVKKALNSVLDWVKKRGNWIWDTVHHPAKLVTWILPSLVTPFLRWLMGHVESVALLIGRWLLSNIGKVAVELERAIAKLL